MLGMHKRWTSVRRTVYSYTPLHGMKNGLKKTHFL